MRSTEGNSLAYNTKITFGPTGGYLSLSPQGFAAGERNYTWNAGYVASLRFRVPLARRDPVLALDLHPFIVPYKVAEQDLNIYINGLWVGFLRTTQPTRYECPFPREHLSSGTNLLSFLMPRATRPIDIGASQDTRLLAFSFYGAALNGEG